MTRPTVNTPHIPQHYQSRPDRSPSFAKAPRPYPYPQRSSEVGPSSIDRYPDDRHQDQRERTTSQPRLPMQRTASETSYRSSVQLPPLHTISQSAFYPPPMPPPRTFTPSRPSPPRTAHDSSAYHPYASGSREHLIDGGSPRVRVKEEPTDHAVYRPTLPRPDGEYPWHYDQYQDHRRIHDPHDHRADRRRARTDDQYVGGPRPARSHYPDYAEPPSPPLRPLHPDGQRQSYLPQPYPHSEYPLAGPSSGKRAPRSEPDRHPTLPAAKNEDVPSGQNRRLAHLMSEQKRRE